MFMRKIGWFFLLSALLSAAGEIFSWKLPTFRWPFDVSRELATLPWWIGRSQITTHWFGWLSVLFLAIAGVLLLVKFPRSFRFSPITQRRLSRFASIKRGYRAFWIVLFLLFLAGLDHLLVGKDALAVRYEGKWYFPALEQKLYKGKDFGFEGEKGETPVNYRYLQKVFKRRGDFNKVWMPLIAYAPTQDTVITPTHPLEKREDGKLYEVGSKDPYSGLASQIYDLDNPANMHLRARFRQGVKDGGVDGWDRKNDRVFGATYSQGELLSDSWNGEGSKEHFLAEKSSDWRVIDYAPAPPSFHSGHLLGTTPQGYDVLAYLYGGLQVNFKAALFFVPIVYVIGVTIGLFMGFYGGIFDLVVQRLIEVFSNVPSLFVLIIVSAAVPVALKEKLGLGVILFILIIFSWMGMTYLMRTAALKEKARDYVAASRVIGCSTPRILFYHILPNAIAIVITLIPFSVSGLVMGLASLDYLGFGLPPKYATWGTLLRDGLANLSAPWLVTSSFCALVGLLILVTFIGEAVREAFDPKKFTYYK